MTYLIEGTLTVEEKPEKYMHTFVDFKLVEEIRAGSISTERRCVIASSERVARWLNKKGYNLQWNDDLERAVEVCGQEKIEVSETKLITPRNGWGDYLTQKFGKTEDMMTLEGELTVWSETRLPIPWLYVFSSGKLRDVFVFDGDRFMVEPKVTHKGSKYTYGVLLDIPILKLNSCQTRGNINTTRY